MWRRIVPAALMVGAFSVMSAVVMATPSVASDGGGQRIEIHDDCQPASFNLVLGKGACIGDGETSFNAFIAEVQATQRAAAWHFDPSMLTVRAGRPVLLKNEGGETHTFTMVKAFGGGIVPILNQLSGNPVMAPECGTMSGTMVMPTLPSPVNVYVSADKERAFKTAGLRPGKYMFQCCIHPWMRVILTVR
jgi:plastocyanin